MYVHSLGGSLRPLACWPPRTFGIRFNEGAPTVVLPVDATSHHDCAPLLVEVVRVLAAAARRSRFTSDVTGNDRREPVNWIKFFTVALAGAAANISQTQAVLARHPGSWEADASPVLTVFDPGDRFEVLAAKLTANDPGQRRTPVDVSGRGGGALRAF